MMLLNRLLLSYSLLKNTNILQVALNQFSYKPGQKFSWRARDVDENNSSHVMNDPRWTPARVTSSFCRHFHFRRFWTCRLGRKSTRPGRFASRTGCRRDWTTRSGWPSKFSSEVCWERWILTRVTIICSATATFAETNPSFSAIFRHLNFWQLSTLGCRLSRSEQQISVLVSTVIRILRF